MSRMLWHLENLRRRSMGRGAGGGAALRPPRAHPRAGRRLASGGAAEDRASARTSLRAVHVGRVGPWEAGWRRRHGPRKRRAAKATKVVESWEQLEEGTLLRGLRVEVRSDVLV